MKTNFREKSNDFFGTMLFLILALIVNSSSLYANNATNGFIKNLNISPERDSNYYVFVDEQALFQNGTINEFNVYLDDNLHYPENAKLNKIECHVTLQFGVNCYGEIGFVKVLRSSGYAEFDNEAIRAIKSSPKWKPAKIGKNFVGQNFVTMAKFKL